MAVVGEPMPNADANWAPGPCEVPTNVVSPLPPSKDPRGKQKHKKWSHQVYRSGLGEHSGQKEPGGLSACLVK